MHFRVTYHAQIRLEERGIYLDDIKKIIRSPVVESIQMGQVKATGLAKGASFMCNIYL